MAVQVQTTGWIGFGFSPNGGMTGSDVVIGWDHYAFSYELPRLDISQDWILLNATEDVGYTVLEFMRDFQTCDLQDDRAITFGDTVHIIYCYHVIDPEDNTVIQLHNVRGTRTVNLFGQMNYKPPLSDAQFLDLRNNRVNIPPDGTSYICTAIEIPQNIRNQTHYVVKYGAVITPESKRHVLHILVHLCEGLDYTGHPSINISHICDEFPEELNMCRTSVIIAGWAVGGEDFVFPEEVAFPIGGDDKVHTHFVLEMRYDNPNFIPDIIDSSGMRLYYVKQPRQFNSSMISVGYLTRPQMVIPPRVDRYTVYGYCSKRCTAAHLPEDGVTIFSNLFHTHVIGVYLKLRHIRNGKELPPIDANLHHDSAFQQHTAIPLVKVLPGDELILECGYNSSNRGFTTFGGESTREETCLAFISYYPATPVTACASITNLASYHQWLMEFVPEENHQAIIESLANKDPVAAEPLFNSLNWTVDNHQIFQQVGRDGEQLMYCFTPTVVSGGFVLPDLPPIITEPLWEHEVCGSGVSPVYNFYFTTICLFAILLSIICN
ncbi:DBH-like monooxygenase protein 1 homolog [Dysidea avara]|uniref:DBH-like monooxygenase protein 1 homolog n=1 Tax=Dysidea avara TaxID=196820 RepID=UPI00331665CE